MILRLLCDKQAIIDAGFDFNYVCKTGFGMYRLYYMVYCYVQRGVLRFIEYVGIEKSENGNFGVRPEAHFNEIIDSGTKGWELVKTQIEI